MTYDRNGNEYIKQAPMPKWLRNFVDNELQKSSSFKPDDVELMVKDLRNRVGLDLITGSEEFEQEKTSNKKEAHINKIKGLIALANMFEEEGDVESAKEVDEKIKTMKLIDKAYYVMEHTLDPNSEEAAELSALIYEVEEGNIDPNELKKELDKISGCPCENCKNENCSCGQNADDESYAKDKKKKKEEGVFDKFPKIKTFIDNICKSRQGHVGLHAILKMLEDERPEKVDVSNEELRDYIEKKIEEEKIEIPDTGDDLAGMDQITVFMITEDDADKDIFAKPPE